MGLRVGSLQCIGTTIGQMTLIIDNQIDKKMKETEMVYGFSVSGLGAYGFRLFDGAPFKAVVWIVLYRAVLGNTGL